ncbi:Nn.00g048010.m01.CDS01 [Neocucurbitaria sp. VM-36]
MVPSPRKRALPTTNPTFNQTWDDNDTASLDPNSLPLSKIPRGWERKQEIKRLGEGREKKIWRRFNLRSRAADTLEEDEEEQNDSRSRAVKKLQRMSPKAMEKTSNGANGKKHAFKATRWDRRKSVLPRKKVARIEAHRSDTVEASESDSPVQEDGHSGMEGTGEQPVESVQSLLPEVDDRRSTFTFTMDASTVDDLPDYESLDELEETNRTLQPALVEDATLTNLFRSPAKRASLRYSRSPSKVQYPELPLSDNQETEVETHVMPSEVVEMFEQLDESNLVEQASVEKDPHGSHATEVSNGIKATGPNNVDCEGTQISLDGTVTPVEIAYPNLPTENEEAWTPPATLEDSQSEGEDAEISEVILDRSSGEENQDQNTVEEEPLDTLDGEASDEEFTEASLQLNIQQEYEEARQKEQIIPMEVKEQHVEIDSDIHMEQTAHTTDMPMDREGTSTEEAKQGREDSVALQALSSPAKVYEQTQTEFAPSPHQNSVETPVDDIADGLTLSFTSMNPSSSDPTPRKLHSPPPPPRDASGPEDVTMTIAIDDDTALLKDFLNRAAASKAEKAATITHRRESLQNRRDSDVIRHALASPRKILEDKDPNSPSKYDNETTLDLSQILTLSMPHDTLASPSLDQADEEGAAAEKSLRGSRRSSRTKKSRLPAPATTTQTQASKIAIRRADGNEVVVLKKSDAQELATVTRANTRKNKQGAFGVTVRLLKLAVDAASLPPIDDSRKELVVGKNVRWDDQLAYYQENPETVANLLAEAESLATPDELSMSDPSSTPTAKSKISKNSTPKVRRVRGLGTANGTPGKGLLAPASLLPEAVQEEKQTAQAPPRQLSKPKASKIKKMPVASTSIDSSLSSNSVDTKLPTLDVAPVGVTSTQRKSRLAAPKKVMMPQPVSTMHSEGKENAQRPGISDATPRKGIPAPKVIVPPTAGMESGLPRRRGRKY